MTVKQLIKRLKKLPKGTKVQIARDHFWTPLSEVFFNRDGKVKNVIIK